MTTQWSPARLPDMTGKRVVVTGATNGVGLGTARALAKAGAHVLMAVRNTHLGAQRASEIGGITTVLKLDLADLSSVRHSPTASTATWTFWSTTPVLSPISAPTPSTGSS